MSGYTTTYHIDAIKALLENGHFDEPAGRVSLTLAINDLETHYKYGNISEKEYDKIRFLLLSKQNTEKTKSIPKKSRLHLPTSIHRPLNKSI